MVVKLKSVICPPSLTVFGGLQPRQCPVPDALRLGTGQEINISRLQEELWNFIMLERDKK